MFTYTLSRSMADDDGGYTSTSITDHDPINAAHCLAAFFNTVNRPMLNGFALGVVNTEAATVEYDGKREDIKRPGPWWSTEHTITFNPTAGDADTILTLFGNGETPTFTAAGKFSFEKNEEAAEALAKAGAGALSRTVLEEAYAELQAVKAVLENAKVETIPADRGVKDLQYMLSARNNEIAKLVQQRANQNAAARDELITLVSGAHTKLQRLDKDGSRDDLQARFQGMLDVFAAFLVATGEADYDERHAVARRLVEKAQD